MKIFIISRGMPVKREPQWGCFEFDQAKGLAAQGHDVVILSIDTRFRLRGQHWGISCKRVDGIIAYDLCYPLIPFSLFPVSLYGVLTNGLMDRLFKVVLKTEGRPDLIHAHYLSRISMGGYLKKKYRIPLVGTEHFSKVLTEIDSNKIKSLGMSAYLDADRVVAVSSFLGKRIKSAFGVDCVVIPNAVDTLTFCFSNKPKPTDNFTFVAVGNLLPIKGFDLLIKAFHTAKFPDSIFLKIVGGGELKETLQRQIDDLGLSERIQLTGRIERSSIAKILEQSHAFVMSSRSETFGVVLIEAMVTGLPVIATDCGGTTDIVDSSNGILVPVEDVDQLSNAMKNMVQKAAFYDGKAISENCKNKFSAEVIAQQMELLYQEVISKSKK